MTVAFYGILFILQSGSRIGDIMFITMCVIAYNEENAIDRILGDIAAQDYNHNDMEVVLVDGASTDNTKKHLDNFKEKYKDHKKCRL